MINYDALSENNKYIFTGDSKYAKTYFWTVYYKMFNKGDLLDNFPCIIIIVRK